MTHELGAGRRVDLHVYNEATAWTLSSESGIVAAPLAEDEDFEPAVAAGRLMGMSLYQDDTFNVRVLVGELDEDEEAAWVGRATSWLHIPDGVLVVAAGSEYVLGWHDEGLEEFSHRVAIPPGDYRVDVLTTLTGVNGRSVLERAGNDEPLGAWWRRTRTDEPMPDWLQWVLLDGQDEDPGHEDEWLGWPSTRYSKLMGDVEHGGTIDWIVQLRPLEGPVPTLPVELDDGLFTEPEIRVPDAFPHVLVGNLANAPERYDDDAAPKAVDVLARVADCTPSTVDGGPVELSASDVEVAARLAWFMQRDSNGELLVDGEGVGDWVEAQLTHLVAEGEVSIRTAADGRLRLGLPETEAVYDLLNRLRAMEAALAALPDGASLELLTATDDDDEPAGTLRLVGTVSGGTWAIERAYPSLDATTLRGALNLAREAVGATVTCLDNAELEAVRERWRADGMHRIAPLTAQGLTLTHDEGARFTFQIASAVLAVRFGEVLPCLDPDDPMAEFDAEFDPDDASTFESLLEAEFPDTDPFFEAPSGREYFDIDDEYLPVSVSNATEPVIEEFVAADAVHVGDVIVSVQSNAPIRGLADRGARWYGTVMAVPFMGLFVEAYSVFADGSSLTTSTNPGAAAGPANETIGWNVVDPATSATDLVEAHRSAAEQHAAERGTELTLIRQDLLGLCEAIDEFLTRRLGR